MSPIVQPQPPAQVPTVPSLPISDMSPQLPVQVPTVPDPVIPVPTVPSPPIFDLPILQPPAQVPMQVPTVSSPTIVQSPAQVPNVPSPAIVQSPAQVPSPPISDISPFVQPPAQVPTFPNQASFPGFPNFTGTFTSTSDSDLNMNPQQSLTDLLSEPLYGWPNQVQQQFEDQSLFDLPVFSGANYFNSDGSIHLADVNVRLVLQGLQVLININIVHPCCTHVQQQSRRSQQQYSRKCQLAALCPSCS